MTETTNTALESRQVPAGQAWAWVVSGFQLFKANPVMWIVILLIYLAIIIPISLVPVLGSIASTLLAPVFAAGMMWGCKALVNKQDLEINHLFEGFKKNTPQLIAVGGIYLLSLLVIMVMVVLSLNKEVVELLMKGKELSPEQASAMMLPILFAMLFIVPILMAYWYAPVLIGLHSLKAVEAMKLSFNACLKNMLPFLLYGLIFTVLLVVAIIPFGLGLIVAIPVMMTSLYTSYVDVFNITYPTIVEQNVPFQEYEFTPEIPVDNTSEDEEWCLVLGVPSDATIDQIKRSYKVLMSQYHPDKVASLGEDLKLLAERKAKEINHAYSQALSKHGEVESN